MKIQEGNQMKKLRKPSVAPCVTVNHLGRGPVALLVGGALLLSMSLAGCSADDTAASPSPPLVSDATPPPSAVALPKPASAFGGANPVSAVDWWKKYPAEAPLPVAGYTVLLNERSKGPRSFSLAKVARYDSMVLAITCVRQDKYRLDVATAANPSWTWAGGNSCGGPFINSSTTPRLEPTNLPKSLKVQVSSDTEYYVVVYGKP
jgi:hypothetical protein